jgi:biotin carboxyl carrier protein
VTATNYVALLDGGRREETLRVERVGAGIYDVTLRGKTHRVDAFHHDHGTISLLVDAESYSVQLDERGTGMRVHLRDSTFPLEILDERRARMRRSPGKLTADGRVPILARLPGKVVGVLRGPGEAVREGEGVLVIEALGMENEVRSPKDGKVVEIAVGVGQTVEGGATLAVVDS